MTEWNWIVLIIAVAVVVTLIAFRDKLKDFTLRVSGKGLDTKLRAHQADNRPRSASQGRNTRSGTAHDVEITGNRQTGLGNRIGIFRRNTRVADNQQLGKGQVLETGSETRDEH